MRTILICSTLLALVRFDQADTYDLLIRHGRIADGTGSPVYLADIAVRDGRIAALGQIDEKAESKTEIDASGKIVAPGFIDVHTHADEVAESPDARNFLRMGVTTVVVGNCGSSKLDISKFFQEIDQKHISINAATLIGHNSVREKAMGGDFDRPPTAGELRTMKALVEQAMKDGAIGLSTGLIYLPGVFSKTDEIVQLATVAAAWKGIYTTHMRHEDSRIYGALDEVFQIARQAHIRAEISHIKLSGERAWGQASNVLELIDKARGEGLAITQDQYAYTASSTGLRQTIPDWAFEGGRNGFLALLKDPAQKAKIIREMKDYIRARGREDYGYAVIAFNYLDRSLNGLNIVQAAGKLRGATSLDAQIETILGVEQSGPADAIFHGINESDLQTFMLNPNTMIASDSGLLKPGVGVPHPRGYGNNARVLARYVRELKVLSLEDAIRKMTSLPADTFQLKQRGQIREGYWADLVVFDPEKVRDTATFGDPHHYATGIPHVLVNGVPVIREGIYTGARPGRSLRHSTVQSQPRPG